MATRVKRNTRSVPVLVLAFVTTCWLFLGPCTTHALKLPWEIKKKIKEYNMMEGQNTSNNERHLAGPLALDPMEAQKWGIKSYLDEYYEKAVTYSNQANYFKKNAIRTLAALSNNPNNQQLINAILDDINEYKRLSFEAKSAKKIYIENLARNKKDDERFDDSKIDDLIDVMFLHAFKETGYNLRDGIGYFYNMCRGMNDDKNITTKNVAFVNKFFDVFTKLIPKSDFDLDILSKDVAEDQVYNFIKTLSVDSAIVKSLIENAKLFQNNVDPLLFFVLIKRESNLNPIAVSHAAAVGLTQIIPDTARSLGMRNIYDPDYLKTATRLFKEANSKRDEAYSILLSINGYDTAAVKKAVDKYIESIIIRRRYKELIDRYAKEVSKGQNDDRVDINKSIYFGMKYFASMMERYNNDISLALSAYNAGPGNVQKYGCIPPFEETVKYRNWIISHYRDLKNKICQFSQP